ncbi:MAG: hypothetical protein MZW92_21600 [Comamonadaceae bacterium]|nr:hypothetical protein [Comamonadaceae bacterium]
MRWKRGDVIVRARERGPRVERASNLRLSAACAAPARRHRRSTPSQTPALAARLAGSGDCDAAPAAAPASWPYRHRRQRRRGRPAARRAS